MKKSTGLLSPRPFFPYPLLCNLSRREEFITRQEHCRYLERKERYCSPRRGEKRKFVPCIIIIPHRGPRTEVTLKLLRTGYCEFTISASIIQPEWPGGSTSRKMDSVLSFRVFPRCKFKLSLARFRSRPRARKRAYDARITSDEGSG